jgi:serine/threonine protein kinase
MAGDDERAALLEQVKQGFFLPKLIEHKYTLKQVIGEGSYGVVCSALDEHSKSLVAVKRIIRVFDELPEAIRTLRELKFLRLLKHHENIISIRDVLLPTDVHRFNDVFVVLELMPTDLTRVLRSQIELSNDHIRWLAYQLLRGAHYLHSSNVLHRDLKPSNILINAMCDLRICDFGLARAATADPNHKDHVFWTDYVATRWYRAPELIMTAETHYTAAIDMWSLGCILAEMLNKGRPLFPGINSLDQLDRIVEVCGPPTPEALSAVRNSKARDHLASMPKRPRRPLASILPATADPLAVSLLGTILEFDPARRPSAAEALAHPYFDSLHDPDTLEQDSDAVPMDEFDFERRALSIDEIRMLLLDEILLYHPDKRDILLSTSNYATESVPTGNYTASNGLAPGLHYEATDQAARFREAMRASEGGHDPPKPWDSMPNQKLRGLCAAAKVSHHAGPGGPSTAAAETNGMPVTTPNPMSVAGASADGPVTGFSVPAETTESLQAVCDQMEPATPDLSRPDDAVVARGAGRMTDDDDDDDLQQYGRLRSGDSAMSNVIGTGNLPNWRSDMMHDVGRDAGRVPNTRPEVCLAAQQMSVKQAHARASETGESMETEEAQHPAHYIS